MANFTAEQLISDVRRRAMLPRATGLGSTDVEVLAYLNDALQMYIAPWLLQVNGEYLVAYEDIPLKVGQAHYPIPTRALGNKLRDVQIYWGNRYMTMQQTEPERVMEYPTAGDPQAYILEGSYVVLVPAPARAQTLRLKYYRRPNELVLSTTPGVAKITNVSLNTAPTGGGSTLVNFLYFNTQTTDIFSSEYVDVVRGSSPFNAFVTNKDTWVGTNTTRVELPVTYFTQTPGVGDWVCFADTSPVAQIPQELLPLLAQRAAFELLEALGHGERSVSALKKCEIMKNQIAPLLTPRSEGAGRVIINPNAAGSRHYWRFYGWQ